MQDDSGSTRMPYPHALRSRRDFLRGVVLGGLAAMANSAAFPVSAQPYDKRTGTTAQEILERIIPPTFPDRNFLITDYGAVPGAKVDCTDAIAQAIEACHHAGGGRVEVPAGLYLTGPIHLKSNVNLYLASRSTLLFSPHPADYPNTLTRWEGVECMNHSPLIYAYGQKNIAVTGRGTLDGGADATTWWHWTAPGMQSVDRAALFDMAEKNVPVEERVFGLGHHLRPMFIQTYACQNVLIEGILIVNAPVWAVHPVLCSNVTINNIEVQSKGPNNDGCDPESCRDVLIEHCVFQTGDDCIAIKSGRNADGRRLNTPSENIVIRHCEMKAGFGAVTIGSEITGSCRNVFIEDCLFNGPLWGLCFRSNTQRGGVIEEIYVKGLDVPRLGQVFMLIDFTFGDNTGGKYPPTLRNIHIEDVNSIGSPRVLQIKDPGNSMIKDINFVDCTFRNSDPREQLPGSAIATYKNVVIEALNGSR